METAARVMEVHGERARLSCLGADSSRTCGKNCGCAIRLLSGGGGGRSLELPAGRLAGSLVAGDTVVLSVPDGLLLRAAAWTYLLPVAGLISGALLSGVAAPGNEALTALAAALGGLAGFGVARRINRSALPIAEIRRAESARPTGDVR